MKFADYLNQAFKVCFLVPSVMSLNNSSSEQFSRNDSEQVLALTGANCQPKKVRFNQFN